MDEEPDPRFESLLEYLKEQRGFDFTGYKRQSLVRRVRRQMTGVGIEGFDEYQDHLALHPDEYAALFDTVLINVTSFFRDTESWEYLREHVLPALLAEDGARVRVWSAGCATGEEPYSLAMELSEALGPTAFRERVKIYATDVDEAALQVARAGAYTDRQVQGLDERYLTSYFERVGDRWVIRKDLRRAVIFGRNDLVQDAPISHVDLLVCRNTLMYFNAEAQADIVRRLHFALAPQGVLFLGKAEMLLSHPHLFQPLELKRRFFRKLGTPAPERRTPREPVRPAEQDLGTTAARLRDEALLSAPAAQVVVATNGVLVASNRRADTLFGIGQRDVGRLFQDLEVSYRPVELRSYIEQALGERRVVWIRDVEWERPDADTVGLDVQVVPLIGPDSAPLGTTVIFNDVTRHRQLQNELQYANRQLESAYEELQSANEELETTNEELQSTVEELETTNEELQSTNEELETMNEELQSMNDELNASNEELRVRTLEVDELNRLMESVLASLGVGVAVVDAGLRVLAWNSRAVDLWGVREDEALGRSLDDLDIGLPVEPLQPLVAGQLDGVPGNRTVRLPAVNRRGRSIDVDVTASRLQGTDAGPGVILLMDVVGPAEPASAPGPDPRSAARSDGAGRSDAG
ncbi:CheR family methyltransferase [Cellulomonas shaoxiangyii]|uniref:CheR family methyltransferase n=1 Tax=Cellulomonas shaoxiangyii TaxID=2566013 RepID=UPI001AA067F7|nr:CheR family methyltransferase [Cellulomonas shaoxiangyii]